MPQYVSIFKPQNGHDRHMLLTVQYAFTSVFATLMVSDNDFCADIFIVMSAITIFLKLF